MAENLEIRLYPTAYEPLRDLERAVGGKLKPPLDQERSPLWPNNPWREQVAACRERLRLRARQALGTP
jgi:hypothetical protein